MKFYASCVLLWILIYGISALPVARRKKARGPTNLLHSLMRDYSKLFRPNNGANATRITLGLDIKDVVSLKEGTLQSRIIFVAWLKLNWTDSRLTWDPDHYNIRDVRLDASKIWTPDIKLINSLDPTPNRDWGARVLLSFDGTIRAVMPIQLPVHCGRPRDPHASWECKIEFRSWTYTVDDLNLVLDRNSSDISAYNDRVWRITGNEARRTVIRNDCCPERYALLTYVLKLIRH